jgi:hypothetical protein
MEKELGCAYGLPSLGCTDRLSPNVENFLMLALRWDWLWVDQKEKGKCVFWE